MNSGLNRIATILKKSERELLVEWQQELRNAGTDGRISEDELHKQAREFLSLLQHNLQTGQIADLWSNDWKSLRDFLQSLSRTRVAQGYSATQTATFILSFKRPLFTLLRRELSGDATSLAEETWLATELLDKLGLMTFEFYQQTREEVIKRQQEELLELSTPVVKLWDGILALPVIGTLDSARTQIVMESLLQRIVETGAEVAIIDITGVPTVDTLVAQHLIKTVTAIRLMGAECIISGIRSQIAQTIVHLGVDLEGITTKATLADALALALKRTGVTMNRGKALQ